MSSLRVGEPAEDDVWQAPAKTSAPFPPAEDDVPGTRRHITAMFCDMVESTPLVESLDPEDFRDVLRAYRQACTRAIERFEGYLAEYVGDGVVAFFGYPRAHEDDAHRAVHAALGVLDELARVNVDIVDAIGRSIGVRIGIHTGVVVAGEPGVGDMRSQVEIVGRTPHIAQRLEALAPPGSIVISDATFDLVDGWFETEHLGEKVLKGVSSPVGVHRVVRATDAVGRLEITTGRPLTPVVGRDTELRRLTAAWRRVEVGNGVVAHVKGEAGIGKSRLVRALTEELGLQVATEHTWQCSAHHRSTALYPVIRLLERLLGLDRTADPRRQREAIAKATASAALDPADAVPLLADLLSVPRADDHEPALSPLDARTAVLRILEALLVTNAKHHPLLLVVEDLHWADPTTVDLLGRIFTGVAKLPVLCVLTFRPEFAPPWSGRHPVIEIALGPLTSGDVRAMANAVSAAPLAPELITWLESAADGVPLFVEEMVKMLHHSGTDLPVGTHVDRVVPPTLEGLLTERLDRLPELDDVIDVAAILGREFDRPLLRALVPARGEDLEPALSQLAGQDVLRTVDGAPSRCEFSHALLQEAAYERILRRRRRTLHARAADTLVRSFAAAAEREPELVAHHWTCAGDHASAVPYWRAAGTRALKRAAYLEAAEHFRRGVEALDHAGTQADNDLQRADLLTHLGASLQAGRGYAAAGVSEAYARARIACQHSGGADRLEAVIRGQWMFHLLRGEYGAALELGDEMLVLGARADNPARLAEGHLYRGLIEMYLGRFDSAREHLGEAHRRYRPPAPSDLIYEAQGNTGVGALAYLALVLWNQGEVEESNRCSTLSLERAEQVGGPVPRAQAWGMRSILHLSRGEPAELSRWVRKTGAHSVDHDIGYWRTVSSLLGGWLRGRAGDLERGITLVEASLDAYLTMGSRLSLPHFQILLADLRLAAGDREGALDLLRSGEEHIEQTGERFSESELFRFKGRALMTGEHPDRRGATVAYERAVIAAREQNAKLLELRATTRLAAHQKAVGEPVTALRDLAVLCDWFDRSADLPDVARARLLLGAEPL
jgi:class 3 adenylate cyclase/tetratricopeptide (TPR) repeat protein